MFLSLVIPAYNEERRIKKILDAAIRYFGERNFDYEVIVVDDGSADKTAETVLQYKIKLNNLILVSDSKNYGKGHAVKKGILMAKGDYVLFADADNSTPLQEFDKFVPFLKTHDVIIGSRTLFDAKVEKRQFWPKVLLGKLGNLLICFLFKIEFSDTQCGFKCFKKEVAQKIFTKIMSSGWVFDVEVVVLALKMNFKIKEIGVVWINDKESKVHWFDYLKVFWGLFFLKRRLKRVRLLLF